MNIQFLKDKIKEYEVKAKIYLEKNRVYLDKTKIYLDKAKTFFIKYKKRIFVDAPLFFMSCLIVSLIFFFGPTVGFILTLVLKPSFSINHIQLPKEFSKVGEVVATGVKLSYNDQKIVDAPRVVLTYDLNKNIMGWMKSIDVYDSKILIERSNSDVNIVDAFSNTSPGKAGLGVPIGIIRAVNADAVYRDISYDFPIEKHIPVVNGYVSFDSKNGIELLFKGPYKDGEISYSFTNYVEEYSMTIKGKNIDLDTNILQYAYYYDEIEYLGGKGDLDLTVSSSGLYGSADIRGLTVNYKSFLETAKNINGHVDFLKDIIKIDADFDIFGKKKKFTLDYDSNSEMNINIKLDEVKYEEAAKYKLLNDIKLPFYVENLKNTNINLKLDKNDDFFVIIDFDLPKLAMSKLEFQNLKNRLVYSNDVLTYSLLESDVELVGIKNNLKFDFKLKDNLGTLTYNLENLSGELELGFEDKNIKINSKSGFAVAKGSYDYETKVLNLYSGKKLEKKYELVYDFKENKLTSYKGNFNFNLSNSLSGELNAEVIDNVGTVENITLYDFDNQEVFYSTGDFDLNDIKYNFEFQTNLLNLNQDIGGDNLLLVSNIVGIAKNDGKNHILEIDGEIKNLKYKNIELNGIKSNFRIRENVIEIKKIGNGLFSLTGNIDLNKEIANLDYKINGLGNESLGIKDVKFEISEASGKVSGNLKDIKGYAKIENIKVVGPQETDVNIKGNLQYSKGILSTEGLLVNEKSSVRGQYNLLSGEYRFKGDIIEESIWKYTGNRSFKYRVIGKFDANGQNQKLNVKSKFTVDSIYFKGDKLPDLEGVVTYSAENINDGIANLEYLKVIKNNYNIGELRGSANLATQELRFDLSENDIDLSKIFEDAKLSGKLKLDIAINGNFSNPNFVVQTSSENINLEKWSFENFELSLSGDKDKIKLEEFNFLYEKNLLKALGMYSFSNSKYNFDIYSKNIKVDFLNSILSDFGVEGVDGTAQIAMSFTDKASNGTFSGQNLSVKLPKYGVETQNLNFNILLQENKIKIDYFKGIVNSGKLDINGYLVIPTIGEVKNNPYFYEKIDYDFSLKMDGVKYIYPEYLSLTLDTDINMASHKLIGSFSIKDGELNRIPGVEENFSIFRLVREYIRDTILRPESKSVSNDELNSNSNGSFGKNLNLSLDFKIINGIKIDLQSIMGIVEDIKGQLNGSGKISGVGEHLKFIGSFDLREGQYVLNNNDFIISQGSVIFNKENDYYPNFNPIIIFDSYSKNSQDNYEISLNGELKKLNFKIKSNKETSSGSLASFFSGDKKGNQNDANGPQSFLVENLLNSQLSNTFLRPFSNSLKTIFGLSKLRITSDISSFETNSDVNDPDGNDRNNSFDYSFGAKIQAEKHLYDKLFLVGDVGIKGNGQSSSSNSGSRSGSDSGGSFNKYDGWLEYRIDNSKAVGVGANKVLNNSSDSETVNATEDKKGTINYYIKFMFYKKYDSFSDIF